MCQFRTDGLPAHPDGPGEVADQAGLVDREKRGPHAKPFDHQGLHRGERVVVQRESDRVEVGGDAGGDAPPARGDTAVGPVCPRVEEVEVDAPVCEERGEVGAGDPGAGDGDVQDSTPGISRNWSTTTMCAMGVISRWGKKGSYLMTLTAQYLSDQVMAQVDWNWNPVPPIDGT